MLILALAAVAQQNASLEAATPSSRSSISDQHETNVPSTRSKNPNRDSSIRSVDGGIADRPAQAVRDQRRSTENVVTQAQDAFGTSVGKESIGLYSSTSVRGFSPVSAGNARIDTLYFDQVQAPTARIRQSTAIRVGLAALGFPFPAPTGIVDYTLKRPAPDAAGSIFVSGDSWGSKSIEFDGSHPLGSSLRLSAGLGVYKNEFRNGTNNHQDIETATADWTPSPRLEIQPFWQRSNVRHDDTGPIYITAGSYLPPRIPRRRNFGPKWAEFFGTSLLYGARSNVGLGAHTFLQMGVFRSQLNTKQDAANVYYDLTPDGRAQQEVDIDPAGKFASTSGEIRLNHTIADGPRQHRVLFSVRARDRRRSYDGSDEIDLGQVQIGKAVTASKPNLVFSEQSRDLVRQWTAGMGYEGRWTGVGELTASVQKTDYKKRVSLPGAPVGKTDSKPWLLNVSGAVYATSDITLYAGYARGLEESGVAPASATNRNQPLPAIRTSQRDAGIRWGISPKLRLIAGVFEIDKPYFQLNAQKLFTLLGDVKSRGIEVSLTGSVHDDLSIVAGAVFLNPKVTGFGVATGRVGKHPVGLPDQTLRTNGDWHPSYLHGLSFDFGMTYTSARPSSLDDSVHVPKRALFDLGARYKLRQGKQPLTFRIAASNVFNKYGFDVVSAGTYDTIPGRLVTASLAADF